jgi:hypothetical protein
MLTVSVSRLSRKFGSLDVPQSCKAFYRDSFTFLPLREKRIGNGSVDPLFFGP